MSKTSIKSFAKKIGVSDETLVGQLESAGIAGKATDGSLSDDEKMSLLKFLQGQTGDEPDKKRITLNRKSTSEIKQKSRTGGSHTIQVEVRKKRTFVKRSVVEEEAKLQAEADEEARKEAENSRAQAEAEKQQKRAGEDKPESGKDETAVTEATEAKTNKKKVGKSAESPAPSWPPGPGRYTHGGRAPTG